MPWQKGQSGNPRGRPKKPRQLTTQLERSLSRNITLSDGTHINGKRYVASIVRQALTTGEVTLASGKKMDLSPDDIIALMRWAFAQIDGPPPAKHELTGADGGAILIGFGEDVSEL